MITYAEALKITEESEAFYVSRGEVQGFEYAMFNYRMALYEDFEKHQAHELRGLTFIKGRIITEKYGGWCIYPMLPKFFNLNENDGTQYKDFKDKDIRSVQFKEDGSLISFVVLPNGNVVPKTKMSFDNDQTNLVNKWLKDKPNFLQILKDYYLINGWTLFFELVSPKNRIVLKYPKTELRLLKGRDANGKTLNKYTIEEIAYNLGIEWAEHFKDVTLDELIKDRENIQDIEGWVIDFSDGSMVKLKTEWYVLEHRLRESLERENDIIKLTLNEEIDDLISELEGTEKAELQAQVALIDHYYNHRVQQALDLRSAYYGAYGADRKAFAIDNSRVLDFGVVMKNLTGEGIPEAIKERVIIENGHLEKARDFLEKLQKDKEAEDCFVRLMVEG